MLTNEKNMNFTKSHPSSQGAPPCSGTAHSRYREVNHKYKIPLSLRVVVAPAEDIYRLVLQQ